MDKKVLGNFLLGSAAGLPIGLYVFVSIDILVLKALAGAAVEAKAAGLAVHAGHGLTYQNTGPVARIREIEELSIGHSVVSRSIMVGMELAVSEMRALIAAARVD